MDLKKLNYLLAVAEELNFSKAARRLGVSQSMVSRAVKEIEDTVGEKLFFRDASSIALTPAGEAFVPRVDEAILTIDEGLKELREASARCETQIDIGYLPSSYDTFVGDILNVFRQTFASTQLTPHPMDAGPMVKALRGGKIDIAFIGHICPELEKEFDVFKLCRIPLAIVLGAQHPLAQQESLKLSELAGLPLISLDSEHFPGRHTLILQALRTGGVNPGEIRQVDSPLTALAHIIASDAFSLMPTEVESIATNHVRFIPLKDPGLGVDFYALVRRDEARKSVLTLLNECKRIIDAKGI